MPGAEILPLILKTMQDMSKLWNLSGKASVRMKS